MGGADIGQGAEHDLPPTGRTLFPLVENRLDLLALQAVLASTKVAGDDGIVHRAGKTVAVHLGHMGEGAADEEVTFLVQQARRHGREAAAVEEIHEEGL